MGTDLISADSHVVEGAEVFAGLSERFGDEAPRVASLNGETDAIVIPAHPTRAIGAAKMGCASFRRRDLVNGKRRTGYKPSADFMRDPEVKDAILLGYAALSEGLRYGSKRANDQDIDGVAAEILYPSYFRMFSIPNVEVLIATQKNYNDWIFSYCAEDKDRLFGLAVIPLQDPEAGLAELKRAISRGVRGGCIPCIAPAGRPYRDPGYDPIWSTAAEAGFPLSMHIGTVAHREPQPEQRLTTEESVMAYASGPTAVQHTVVELICRGVAERHPDLKFVLSEFNAGWIAQWLDRVDQGYARDALRLDGGLKLRPSEYWRRQFFATIEDDRPAVLTRELIGVDNLMWGNDYPHLDSTWPCSEDVVSELFRDVSPADRLKVTSENVKRLYRIDHL